MQDSPSSIAEQRFLWSHKVLRGDTSLQAPSWVLAPQRQEAELLLVGDPTRPAARVLDLAGLSGGSGGTWGPLA